jgi:ferric-dicitrate binding protein FerR (iron transport regulator)
MTWPIATLAACLLAFVGWVLYLSHRKALHLDRSTADGLRKELKALADSTQTALDAAAKAHGELADKLTHLGNRIPARF